MNDAPAKAKTKGGLQRFSTRVLDAQRPADDLVLLRMARPDGYTFDAGQWTYVFLPADDDKRAYSIASPPGDGQGLEFCVKKVPGGPASNRMYALEPDEELEISRPLGTFRFDSPPGRAAVFLGTGTGVAPLRAMLLDRLHQGDPRPLWLFLGSGHENTLPYHAQFQDLAARHANLHYVPVVSKGGMAWKGERGWIQEAFIKHFHRRHDIDAYVCGLKRMVEDVRELLLDQGVPAEQVHRERYD